MSSIDPLPRYDQHGHAMCAGPYGCSTRLNAAKKGNNGMRRVQRSRNNMCQRCFNRLQKAEKAQHRATSPTSSSIGRRVLVELSANTSAGWPDRGQQLVQPTADRAAAVSCTGALDFLQALCTGTGESTIQTGHRLPLPITPPRTTRKRKESPLVSELDENAASTALHTAEESDVSSIASPEPQMKRPRRSASHATVEMLPIDGDSDSTGCPDRDDHQDDAASGHCGPPKRNRPISPPRPEGWKPNDRRIPLQLHFSPMERQQNRSTLIEPTRFFEYYSYLLQPSTLLTRELAPKLRALLAQITPAERATANAVSPIPGKQTMHTLTHTEAFKSVRADVWSIAIAAGRRAGVNIAEDYILTSVKMLEAEPDDGEQVVHWDTLRAWLEATYGLILNCSEEVTDGIDTTAMPRFSTKQEFRFKNPKRPTMMELQLREFLLDPRWYHRVKFEPAATMFFKQSVPHFGTRNRSKKTRYVLYCHLVKRTSKRQESYPGAMEDRQAATGRSSHDPEDLDSTRDPSESFTSRTGRSTSSSSSVSRTTDVSDSDSIPLRSDDFQYFPWLYAERAHRTSINPHPLEWAQSLARYAHETPIARYGSEEDKVAARKCLEKHQELYNSYYSVAPQDLI